MDLFFLLVLASFLTAAAADNDTAALSLFRSQTDIHGALLSNWTTAAACTANWLGVQCTNHRVTAVSLPGLNLRGPIAALSALDQLRHLDLRRNRLNGPLTPIALCPNLKLLHLAANDFSGQIPPDLSSLHRLLRLDLSDNNLGGPIPPHLSNLSRLISLNLDSNQLTGTIPDSLDSLPHLKTLNLSNNELYGTIPSSLLLRYGGASFSGNQRLCRNPNCSIPANNHHHRKRLSNGAIIALVVVISLLLIMIASFTVTHCCAKSSKLNTDSMARVKSGGGDISEGDDKSKLVFFDRRKQFELEDLLRASAEMVGKGSLGTVYKAVLEDGGVVAVKRLKDSNPCGRKEFEQYMDVIGKLKHLNVVRFRAYYYATQEKLLVYDFLPNATLHSLLHGSKGAGRIPLDWTTRISLVLGAARGLARIHEEYGGSRIPHGNIKSSNILLDKNGNACISDFGLSLLLNPTHAIARLGGYRAPEQAEMKRLSQMADVYSFGVVLLEVITGRVPLQYPSPARHRGKEEEAMDLPKWVRSVVRDEWTAEVFDQELLRYKNIEEELVSMLHVAMACVVAQPEKRPTMVEVVRMIEEIGVEPSPLGEDYGSSRNSLSPSIATTEDALA